MQASVGNGAARAHDTFPKLLMEQARERPDKVFLREKDYGIWQSWTWQRSAVEARDLALGLAAHGFQRGDKVAIIGDNRPVLYLAAAAAQSLGGVPVPIYQDSIADEMLYILDHAEVRFAVVEDQEQVDKLLQIRDKLPRLEMIVYDDPRGMRHYREPGLEWSQDMLQRGQRFDSDTPDFYETEVAAGKGSDLAI
ncbi:MAG: AMP-binding protein, partial [Alphaproteobacteria bacterium]|nr:AMP-binding protein [Alphaproteobacteria bacterium]